MGNSHLIEDSRSMVILALLPIKHFCNFEEFFGTCDRVST